MCESDVIIGYWLAVAGVGSQGREVGEVRRVPLGFLRGHLWFPYYLHRRQAGEAINSLSVFVTQSLTPCLSITLFNSVPGYYLYFIFIVISILTCHVSFDESERGKISNERVTVCVENTDFFH